MDLQQQIVDAMLAELRRQAEEGGLTLQQPQEGEVRLDGRLDLESLAMVVIGHVAGGP